MTIDAGHHNEGSTEVRKRFLDHFEPRHAAIEWRQFYLNYLKRLMDIVVIGVMLPIWLPILIVAMMAILVVMRRPLFHVQDRVGRGGKVFKMFKLRTMQTTPLCDAIATRVRDSRITQLGKYLRRFRIDELPQFFNVLRGDMSLIGPRPEQLALSKKYEEEIPGFAHRNVLLPGITGWAQIRAGYAANTNETRDKLSYDLYYVMHVSLLFDLWIMLLTPRAIVIGTSSR